MLSPSTELADLHIHVGGAVAPHILWSIAHEHGFKLPVKTYWEFRELVTAHPTRVKSLDDYLHILHQWTEKIQSSPHAIERSVYEIIGKEYRASRVSLIELRFNPMKRNLGGERDLDHIIHAALRGLDRACLEYGVRAGLIFCLAREFPLEHNEILLKKAIRYRGRGVVGIDLAGPEKHTLELGEEVMLYRELFARARKAGLGTTIHTGETAHTAASGVLAVLEKLEPDRIGHGVAAAESPEAMAKLAERGCVLEICPSSNLRTRAVRDVAHLCEVLRNFGEAGVRFTVNTDGPYLLATHMRQEIELLMQAGALNESQVLECITTAQRASFVR
ncbi:MAG TPA: adenosine deaminase [Polyangia bacterium]|nr:adenosine deaminase [Polyangia bacterium]